jgi:hypothetical protein
MTLAVPMPPRSSRRNAVSTYPKERGGFVDAYATLAPSASHRSMQHRSLMLLL